MIGLNAFDDELLPRVARLMKQDPDFKDFVKYLTAEVTNLALKSTRLAGEQGDKAKGACIVLQELRDMIIQAPNVFDQFQERKEFALLDNDTISP
jgi:hypothetical protein